MDAESRRRRRESSISLQERRWSMSSQRLEQIVAALIKPVSHYAQSFDRDDSGMLEAYLTEAGLRAIDAEDAGEEYHQPNFVEMGLIIQGFAANYCKKVDHLSRLTNNFYNMLLDKHNNNNEDESPDLEANAFTSADGVPRRRRASQGPTAFVPIELTPSSAARREASPPGPPPTLPRGYAELQPRAAAAERALTDYTEEPIGSLDDFRVAWRLHNGFLVEELEGGVASGSDELRPLSLMELQEACARAAAPALPPLSPHTPPPCFHSPTPPPLSPPPTEITTPEAMPPPAALKRKRRSEVRIEDLMVGSFNLEINAAIKKRLEEVREFSLSERWVKRVVRHRRDQIINARQEAEPPVLEFHGFDTPWMDIGGFCGWSGAEALAASNAAKRAAQQLAALESDDDGFYERSSSLGDSNRYSLEQTNQVSDGLEAEAESWQTRVARRAEAAEPLHLPTLARDVRRVLEPPGASSTWEEISYATRHTQPQTARVLLDILMKASRGEVEIEQGAPLSIGQFSVRLLPETPPPIEEEESQQLIGPPARSLSPPPLSLSPPPLSLSPSLPPSPLPP